MTVSEVSTVTCKPNLIEKLAARRASILASCEKCGGLGVVQGNGGEVPCPKCRLSDLTTHLIGDVRERFDNAASTRAISPSEIESFIQCQRRWGWERLDGIKVERGNEAAELGKATHKQLERWFIAGILPDPHEMAGLIAESGLHLWPAPDLVTEIEIHIGCETDAGRYHGYQDIGYLDSDGVWVVGDHKTTGDFKWAKVADRYDANGDYDPNNLPDNIQANIYARAAMERHGVERVKLRWVYYRTKGARKAYPVEIVVTVPEVERVFEEIIDPVAREIHAAEASGKTGIDMEPNAKSCSNFGGCPHEARCNLSPTQRLVSIMAQQSLKEKIEAKKALAAASGNAPVIPAAPAPHINPPESVLPPAPAVVPAVAAAAAPAPEAAGGVVVPASSFAAKMAAKKAGGAAPETPAEAPAATAPKAAKAASAKAPPTDALSAARAAKAAADLAFAEAEKTAAAEAEAARLAAIAEATRVEAEAKAAAETAAIAAANPPPKATRKAAAASTETAAVTGISKRLLDVCAALEGADPVEQRRVLAAVSSLLGV